MQPGNYLYHTKRDDSEGYLPASMDSRPFKLFIPARLLSANSLRLSEQRYAIEVILKLRVKFKKSLHNWEEGVDPFAQVGTIELKVLLAFDRPLPRRQGHPDTEKRFATFKYS